MRRGLEREDLFVVVHEQFQTDTADFADILLPATTTLEHYDIHKAYGHLYVSLSRPAIAPLGEALPNTELFRRLAARMGLDHPCLRESDEQMARQSFKWDHPFMAGITFDRLEREGSVRLSVPEPFAPFREGGFPTPSGKCELVSERLGAEGHDPVAGYTPPREGPTSAPELAKRYPARLHLAARPPLPELDLLRPADLRCGAKATRASRSTPGTPPLAASRRGPWCASSTTAASFLARARVSDAARPGVVVGLSIWWAKLCPGGRNANAVTSQELTDMGGGATFFDALVDVAPAP